MKKILITGSNGQVGSVLQILALDMPEYEFLFTNRFHFTFGSKDSMVAFFNANNPDFIINCAAYTAVDKAESEAEDANLINHYAVGIIAEWCKSNQSKLLHISTDYVFDGTSCFALTETDTPNPQSVYGKSKFLGESIALKNNPNTIIIRTSWVYSQFGSNFVKTMLRLMQERDSLNVVQDQIGSPTYAKDLAAVILEIIKNKKWVSGIFNYSNEGEISWYQFAKEIKEIANLNCVLKGISTSEYPTPAKRPAFSLLDKSKIKNTYEILIPEYKDSLKQCLQALYITN